MYLSKTIFFRSKAKAGLHEFVGARKHLAPILLHAYIHTYAKICMCVGALLFEVFHPKLRTKIAESTHPLPKKDNIYP